MTDVIDPFWLKDPTILFRSDRLLEFYITKDMANAEKLNAIARLSIYISIILALYKSEWKYLLLSLLGLALTLFIYKFVVEEQFCPDPYVNKDFTLKDREDYTVPTLNNPFMNKSIVDIADDPNRKPAIPYADKTERSLEISKDIEDKFSYNLYQDVSDVYGTANSRRQWYTVPGSFTQDDAMGQFKNFLFGDLKSAKENSYVNIKNVYEPLKFSSKGIPKGN